MYNATWVEFGEKGRKEVQHGQDFKTYLQSRLNLQVLDDPGEPGREMTVSVAWGYRTERASGYWRFGYASKDPIKAV